jgi:hypothetical protein
LGWYSLTGQLLYDCATWRGLLVRDNKLTFGGLLDVAVFSVALSDDGKTEKKAKQDARFKVALSFLPRIPRGFALSPAALACFFGLRFLRVRRKSMCLSPSPLGITSQKHEADDDETRTN